MSEQTVRMGRDPAGEDEAAQETASGAGRVSARTLIAIRWIAVLGQAVTLLAAESLVGVEAPLQPSLAAILLSLAVNLYAANNRRRQPFLGEREAAAYLAYDTGQLAVLLCLTGGLENPFAVLMLAPLTVAASTLSLTAVVALAGWTVLGLSALALFAVPLSWPSHTGIHLPPIYLLGIWSALVLAALFIAGYVFQVAQAARNLSGALAASQMALARAQRVSAVGALAAAAAHELGSPLGTIAVVAKELAREVPPDSPWAEDIQLLQSQTARCRDILAELARRPDTEPYAPVPLPALVEEAAAPYRRAGVSLAIRTLREPEEGAPGLRHSPEVLHGLGNVLQNAMQFARSRVTVEIDWTEPGLCLSIADDGPGFPPTLLDRLGEPYLSGRGAAQREAGGNMGLGLFIAQTLLERTGAAVSYANGRAGGAQVVVRWQSPTFTV
ncbi:MAG TPA: ActS/PrrB/RegB family redox-sensitive histidine kinase [Azospirillaceae bacterium]|nr:ActS/PrrB/RegB family redox-sensitive histidine kinase [Azospirillaceae bacterium]